MESEKRKPGNAAQICKIQNAKKLIEFCDSLKPAGVGSYAKLHADGDEEVAGGGRQYSRIRLNLVDYADGTGKSLKRAEFNLSASEMRRILWESKREILRYDVYRTVEPLYVGVEQVAERSNMLLTALNFIRTVFSSQEKLRRATAPVQVREDYKPWELRIDKLISSKRNDDGSSPMSRLSITRIPLSSDGKPMQSPWRITIDNGTAIAKQNQNGGSYAERGSFKSGNGGALYFNASDEDWIAAVEKVVAFIDTFEKAYCCATIRKGRSIGVMKTPMEMNENRDTPQSLTVPGQTNAGVQNTGETSEQFSAPIQLIL